MHYYNFNIGDYKSHTDYLTPMEDLCYRRMLDWCYLHEKPLPKSPEEVARKIGLRNEALSVEVVLTDFFEKTGNGYIQSRISDEILAYKAKADKARENGKRGGRPRKETQNKPNANPEITDPVNLANQNETGLKAKHKPITNNHKPITKRSRDNCQAGARQVFDYWCQVFGKNGSTLLNEKRSKAINARLKEGYSVEDIQKAIDGCSRDAWHMGQNKQQKAYNDIELICRNGSKLESFMTGNVTHDYGTSAQATMNNLGDWVNE